MANVNTLKTRILNKYDTYANWLAATTFYPRAGEVCIAEMGSQNITQADGTQVLQPVIGIKVGLWDGVAGSATQKNFEQLPWVQAIAGDVYAWAKASVKPTYKASEIEELESFIAGEIQDTNTTYKIEDASTTENYVYNLFAKENDGEWDATPVSVITVHKDTLVSGSANGTVAFNGADVKVTGLKSAAYEDISAFDAAGAAEAVRGTASDAADANTVYGAKAAAAAAQTSANSANEKIDAFMADDAQVAGAIDTLVEINKYITDDTQAFTALSERVGKLEDGTTPAAKAEVASSLDTDGVDQVKGIQVNKATDATQLGGVAAASYALKTDVTNAVEALDSSVSVTAEVKNTVSVLTGITQTDGKLTAKTEVTLAAIAKTGDISDLTQGEEDFLILDCGSATRLI